jgi:hypothetical protein
MMPAEVQPIRRPPRPIAKFRPDAWTQLHVYHEVARRKAKLRKAERRWEQREKSADSPLGR